MSDDLFFEGEEPVEESKKKEPAKKKPVAKGAGGKTSSKGSGPVKKASAKQMPTKNKDAAFEFTPTVVILIAVIALLVGFLGGLLAANAILPTANPIPPASQQMPPQGEMGGGGMGDAPILDDDQMMGEMPPGHPPIDDDGNVVMPGDGADIDAPVDANEESEGY
ncbi:MAG: hypothetical protein FWE48_03180 [Coriobacteriia bacterium]|nr:hypothetical protein [Coriobacteriia bacterium]MCL2870155.1 hypothetical protein [Coriobacteriia bacterium]